jgi:hypothetical protein
LIHVVGSTENKTALTDNSFGVSVDNSYRLKRIVEMFQWQETAKTEQRQQSGRTITSTTYTYNKVWSTHKLDSSRFNKHGFDNPQQKWPFTCDTLEAQNVTIGGFKLNPAQVCRLGHCNSKTYNVGEAQVVATKEAMKSHQFSEF